MMSTLIRNALDKKKMKSLSADEIRAVAGGADDGTQPTNGEDGWPIWPTKPGAIRPGTRP